MRHTTILASLVLFALLIPAPARADWEEAGWDDPELSDDPEAGIDEEFSDDEEFDEVEGRKMLSFGARGGPWLTVMQAELSFSEDDVSGSDVNLTSDLDLDEFDALPYAEVFLTSRFVSIYADFWHTHRTGETTLDADLTFGGVIFADGVQIETEYEVATVGGRIKISPFSFDFMELGILIGARYFWAEGRIESKDPLFPETIEEEIQGPLPAVGLELHFFPGPLEVYGSVLGFVYDGDYDGETYAVTYLEGEAGVAFNLGDHVGIGVGYRVFFLEIERGEEGASSDDITDRLEMTQHGPIIWARIRF